MLNLTTTTDKLQVVTDVAGSIDVIAYYVDLSGTTVTPGRQRTAISTAATTDVVAAPAASTYRNVKGVRISNTHATTQTTVTVLYNDNGNVVRETKETLAAGDQLTMDEGVGWYRRAATSTSTLYRSLTAAATGTNVNTAQPWFPATGSATVVANTTYQMEGLLYMTRAAGTTSHTTGLLFGGTATLTSIMYCAEVNVGDVATTSNQAVTIVNVATNTAVKAASVSATEVFAAIVTGTVRINAGGTFIPQFQYSAAPGGAPSILTNTYFKLTPLGSGTVSAIGSWA